VKEHFEQEEQTLFPLFEKGVPEDIQKELGSRASEYAHPRSERKHIGGPT
jgi:hemerythrin-like domain-containing protein